MSAPNYVTGIRYITYKCNTCGRTLDVLQDNLRSFIDRCTITQHCKGKLAPISLKTLRNVLASSEHSNLQDRISSTNVKFQTSSVPIALNSQKSIITLAVKETPSMADHFFLKFNINSSVSSYKEYTYSLSNFNSIMGADSLSSILKFTPADTVLVYINGILWAEGQTGANGYTLVYNSSSIGYLIQLSTEVFVQSSVRVVVYTPSAIQYTNNIEFIANSASNLETSWSNVTRVFMKNSYYRLYSSNDLNVLPLNTRLNLFPGDNNFDISTMDFLLANPNYTPIDRNYVNIVSLNNLATNENFLNVYNEGTDFILECTPTCVETIIPIDPDRASLLNPTMETPTNLVAVSNSSIINTNIESNIIGVI